jgi:hypothetical protein
MKTLWAKLVRWLARKEIEQMAGEIRELRSQIREMRRAEEDVLTKRIWNALKGT